MAEKVRAGRTAVRGRAAAVEGRVGAPQPPAPRPRAAVRSFAPAAEPSGCPGGRGGPGAGAPPARERSRVATVVLAGGEGRRLLPLTARLPKPALPFGPRGRIVDFALENCLASGLPTVAVLTQYRAAPLESYIASCFGPRFRRAGGALALVPAGTGPFPRCEGNAEAILADLHALGARIDTLLVLAADHVYRMDYGAFIDAHEAAGADLTVAAVSVPIGEASRFGVIEAAEDGTVRAFAEKPERPRSVPGDPGRALASMGIYVFRRRALEPFAREAARRRGADFGRDIVPGVLRAGGRVRMFRHDAPGSTDPGLWFDVGTPESLLDAISALHPGGAVDPEARVDRGARLLRSVARAGAEVEEGASAEDSFLLDGAVIERGARVRRAVVGAVRVPAGTAVEPPAERPRGAVILAPP